MSLKQEEGWDRSEPGDGEPDSERWGLGPVAQTCMSCYFPRPDAFLKTV